MPQLCAVPKLWMQQLCKTGEITLRQWLDIAAELKLDGVEWYSGFLEMNDEANWSPLRQYAADRGLAIPMMCCSPDFTHPDAAFRAAEIAKEKHWIRMSAALGCRFTRVLSGQRRPEVSRSDGIHYTVECITACLPFAQEHGITLILENHYKDDFWEYPEFAQPMDIFCDIVKEIEHANFGVNFDPSNTILIGEDPIELLRRVAPRVVTMHASDRYLAEGTLEDLRREEGGVVGYAKRLRHGEIGKGMNDYDAIFTLLRDAGFNGWISIEDGVDGIDQLRRSAEFLRRKMSQYWPAPLPPVAHPPDAAGIP
jgi:sugar phosphate isomerase/epimerase